MPRINVPFDNAIQRASGRSGLKRRAALQRACRETLLQLLVDAVGQKAYDVESWRFSIRGCQRDAKAVRDATVEGWTAPEFYVEAKRGRTAGSSELQHSSFARSAVQLIRVLDITTDSGAGFENNDVVTAVTRTGK